MVDQPPADASAQAAAGHAATAVTAAGQAQAAAGAAQAALATMTAKAEVHASNWVSGHKLEALAIAVGALAFFGLLAVLAVHGLK